MRYISCFLLAFALFTSFVVQGKTYDLRKYGIQPDSDQNTTSALATALQRIVAENPKDSRYIVKFPKGKYNFFPIKEMEKEYYISNHDQNNPKNVGIAIEGMKNLVFDGQGSEFIFHGRMLPLSIIDSKNCTFKNFSIDFANPHITQFKIVANDTEAKKITLEVAPWVKYKIENGVFIAYGEGWQHTPQACIAFEGDTKHVVYNTSDLGINVRQVKETAPRTIVAENWHQPKLKPGTVIAARTWHRPTPGIFMYHSDDTRLENVKVHYAEGMGLLAQICRNITLDGFGVCLKGKDDPRYFTAQADATHFSGCKGKITSVNGLYEGMMDDAINIHGTYLKVTERLDDYTLIGTYMHSQSWGFEWGRPGDKVQFIKSSTMELTEQGNEIAAIETVGQSGTHGARSFRIKFTQPVEKIVSTQEGFGIENLEWTPEVLFAHNTIRNNRARGALFSTPKKTVIENNLFDHTSGTAILLCGDCNGWYETGACRDVLIKNNTFINALTSLFQFTNAIISIYPEIPNLKEQVKYFHGGMDTPGIVIENNRFETFDAPILYAKSVNNLIFKNNKIIHNQDYPAFHWNKHPFFFEQVTNVSILFNDFDIPLDSQRDIRLETNHSKSVIQIK